MRRTAKILAAAAIAVATLAGHASAQDNETAGNARSGSDANVTNYEFTEGSDVQGGSHTPDGEPMFAGKKRRHDTLIHPRMHYVDRLLTSVENI